MSKVSRPAWTKNAQRIDEPAAEVTYRPEQGMLEGELVGKAETESKFRPGEMTWKYLIKQKGTLLIVGLYDKPALRRLRFVPLGARVCVLPTECREVTNDRGTQYKVWDFELYVDEKPSAETSSNGAAGDGGGDSVPF